MCVVCEDGMFVCVLCVCVLCKDGVFVCRAV